MTIKIAQKSDLEKIKRWLCEEHQKNGEGFWDNVDCIESHFRSGKLFVYQQDKEPIGFITGPLNGPDILTVKENHRNKGIGEALVEYIINKAQEEDIVVIKIRCKPIYSIPFWEKMGFYILSEEGKIYAYKLLNSTNEVPPKEKINVILKIYPESKLSTNRDNPIRTFNPYAVKDKYGTIFFRERVIFEGKEYIKNIEDIIKEDLNSKNVSIEKKRNF